MEYLLIIVVVLFPVVSQTLTEQNCVISLDRDTNGSTYRYEPILITIKANVTNTEQCVWRVNDRQQEIGRRNSCTYQLNLTSNVKNVSCIIGQMNPQQYRIFFEQSE